INTQIRIDTTIFISPMILQTPRSTLFPYTTLFRSFSVGLNFGIGVNLNRLGIDLRYERGFSNNEATFLGNNGIGTDRLDTRPDQDRKSTRLNSSHVKISYAVFCLKKKKKK